MDAKSDINAEPLLSGHENMLGCQLKRQINDVSEFSMIYVRGRSETNSQNLKVLLTQNLSFGVRKSKCQHSLRRATWESVELINKHSPSSDDGGLVVAEQAGKTPLIY